MAIPSLAQSRPQVSHLELLGVSPPLREIVPEVRQGPATPRVIHNEIKPYVQPPASEQQRFEDTAVQRAAGPLIGTTDGLNFDGISADGTAPPDTNASVGPSQVVETVNVEYAVYDKTTGNKLLGPLVMHTIWSSIGGVCGTVDGGDPVVVYDKAAGRWLISQLSSNSSGSDNEECIAVSRTSDATGKYNLYAIKFGANFPDYPKFGVWPDAYYFSANLFGPVNFIAPEVCAFQRSAMLAGTTAASVCFQAGANDWSFLPSDLDGATAPPTGEPNFFLELWTNNNNSSTVGTQLHLFKFHVDFTTPSNSSFTGPTAVNVSSYTLACGGGTCVPQTGTSNRLDSLGDRLMFRLAYRNFGSFAALVASHSVKGASKGNQTGERWYEIHNPNGTPSVNQQSTFVPDTTVYRWMGSIAEDKLGDIALGYSSSSSMLHPGIRYSGRVPTDAPNTLETEKITFTGNGSQTQGLNRWGDYSTMSIDPVDDCTFWYAGEYIPKNGSFNWKTRINSFKFPACQ